MRHLPRSLLLSLLAVLSVPGASLAAPFARLEVVATLPDLAALVREVAGPGVRVSVLLRDHEDPFGPGPRPEQALKLSRADLLCALGGPLEAGWLGALLPAARNPRLGDYLEGTRILPSGPGSYPLGDPRQAIRLAQAIATQLATLDPPGAAAYHAAAAAFSADLSAREKAWLLHLGPLHGQKVVTYDDSFHAFLAWAGLTEAATLAPEPGVSPSPVAVLGALRRMREANVHLVLLRDYEPAQVAQVLAGRAPAQVLTVPLGARFERGDRYADGMDELVRTLIGAYHMQPRRPATPGSDP